MLKYLIVPILFLAYSCKETPKTYTTPVKIQRSSGIVVLSPIVNLDSETSKKLKSLITGLLVTKLEPYALSYSLVSEYMPSEYSDFAQKTSEVSVASFTSEDKLIASIAENKSWKDIYTLRFNLFAERFAEALNKRHLNAWKPEYILILTVKNEGVSFSGSRTLNFTVSIFELKSGRAVWGISFSKDTVNNSRSLIELSVKSVGFITDKINLWLKNKPKTQKNKIAVKQ